jgi:hypothetical protein
MVQPIPRKAGFSFTEARIFSFERFKASVSAASTSMGGKLDWKNLLNIVTAILLATLPAV